MQLPELIEYVLSFVSIFFGITTGILLVLNIKTENLLKKREKDQRQKIYQVSMLKEIQDRVGYSLDVEKIVDVITSSLKKLFPYSTASSIVIKENKMIIKTYVEEAVSHAFVSHVKNSMLASISALVENPPTEMEEQITGALLNDNNYLSLASFFHIPLIVNNKVVGLINVSSTKQNLYKEEEMTILYQITNQASSALSKLENVLETEKERLISMVGSLADGVFMVSTKNQLLIINNAAKKFLNIINNDPTYLEIIHSLSGIYDIQAKINEVIKENKVIEEKEILINGKFFQAFITPVHTGNEEKEEVIGASILLHDITIEKQISKIKEDFTYMMVHELRAPLTAIKYSADVLLGTELKEEERLKLLNIIGQQSRTMLEEISSVLDAAKIEAGRFTINKTLSSFNKIVNEAISTFKSYADKKQISIIHEINPKLPQFEFDSLRINQVLNNLISNSLKFTPESGKIIISAKLDELTKELIVSVKDNGIGIPKNEQEDLFTKFYQIRKTPHELAKGGTGLGLYIVKGIVEAHNGRVFVESEEGQGSTISFTLPLLNQTATSESEYQKIYIPKAAYKTIN